MLTKVCSALTMLDRRSTASGVQCCARTPSSAFKYACTDDSQPLSHAHVCKVIHLLERRLYTPIQHTSDACIIHRICEATFQKRGFPLQLDQGYRHLLDGLQPGQVHGA